MTDDAPRPIIESPDGDYETNGDPALAPRPLVPPRPLCGAVNTITGAACTLEAGHEQNHWGLFQHGSVQWPKA